MHIHIHEAAGLTEIWLTKTEHRNPVLGEQLKAFCARCSAAGCPAVVFVSGSQDLYRCIHDLLAYNQKRLAELEIHRETRISG